MTFKYLVVVMLLICNFTAYSQESYINNPVDVKFGDPYILKGSDSIYYMVGTGGLKDGFKMFSSTNLKDWKDEGRIYKGNTDTSWNVGNFWAPELYEINQRFYLFFSADWRKNPTNEKENFRIGVAVSDNVKGPYEDLYNRPIFDPGYPIIDANLLFEDGKVYLYYSRCCYKNVVETELSRWARSKGMFNEIEESWVYGVEIKSDFSGIIGEPILLLRPPLDMSDKQSEWESRSVTAGEVNRRWTEGSYIFKRNDLYYLMYSANYFGGEYYAVGYATSNSPLGPFTKAIENPILEKNTDRGGIISGTGHNSLTIAPNGEQLLCVYHARTTLSGNSRLVFIDNMEIQSDGKLKIIGPTLGNN